MASRPPSIPRLANIRHSRKFPFSVPSCCGDSSPRPCDVVVPRRDAFAESPEQFSWCSTAAWPTAAVSIFAAVDTTASIYPSSSSSSASSRHELWPRWSLHGLRRPVVSELHSPALTAPIAGSLLRASSSGHGPISSKFAVLRVSKLGCTHSFQSFAFLQRCFPFVAGRSAFDMGRSMW